MRPNVINTVQTGDRLASDPASIFDTTHPESREVEMYGRSLETPSEDGDSQGSRSQLLQRPPCTFCRLG